LSISVGDAILKLGVDTKDLDKGMQGIGASIKKHQKAIGLGMVAAGGAIVAAGALSIKTFAEMGDEVAKLARKTGFSTEALSELRHVAEISGTSLEGLEKATKRMSTAIGDAQDGLTETIRDFDKLGISVEELEGLSPEEAFLKLGQAIADIEDPLVRANVAQGIFGRAGMDLIPMFDEGAEAMATLRQEAHDLGIVFDQEAAKKAEELTDAMHRVNEATSGVKMVIAEQLIPILIPLIGKVKDVISGISAWAQEHPELTRLIVLATGALGFLLIAMGSLLLLMPGIQAAITLLTGRIGLMTAAQWLWNAALLANPIGLIIAAVLALIAIGIVLWQNWDMVTAAMSGAWEAVGNTFKRVGQVIQNTIQTVINYVLEMWGYLKAFWDWLMGLFGIGIVRKGVPTPDVAGWLGEAGQPLTEIPMAQHGGIAMRQMPVMVAEKVPEAIIPLDRGTLERLGIGGSRTADIRVYLDERVLVEALGMPLVESIRLRTGVHI